MGGRGHRLPNCARVLSPGGPRVCGVLHLRAGGGLLGRHYSLLTSDPLDVNEGSHPAGTKSAGGSGHESGKVQVIRDSGHLRGCCEEHDSCESACMGATYDMLRICTFTTTESGQFAHAPCLLRIPVTGKCRAFSSSRGCELEMMLTSGPADGEESTALECNMSANESLLSADAAKARREALLRGLDAVEQAPLAPTLVGCSCGEGLFHVLLRLELAVEHHLYSAGLVDDVRLAAGESTEQVRLDAKLLPHCVVLVCHEPHRAVLALELTLRLLGRANADHIETHALELRGSSIERGGLLRAAWRAISAVEIHHRVPPLDPERACRHCTFGPDG